MTQPVLDFFTKRAFAAKQETTEGVDAAPSLTTNGILLMNGSSSTQFDKVERQVDTPYFTAYPFVAANPRGLVEGDFELFCPATPGQVSTSAYVQDVLLLCSGMTSVLHASAPKTTTYSPISTAIPSMTMYGWIVDKKRILLGARNNITGLAMKIGDRFKGHLQVQGTYGFTDVALPAVTTYGSTPAVSTYANSTLILNCAAASITNLSLWGKSLSIDFGNALTTAEYTTLKSNRITDRKGKWTAQFARTALSDFNPWAVRDAGQILTLAYQLNEGGTLHSILSIRGQIDTISEESINGDSGWTLSGPLVASSAGGDEFFIQFLDQ